METFTPFSALIGGALIGLAAVMLMGLNGRVAGISGIFSAALFGAPGDRLWRVMFVAGLIAAPLLYIAVTGQTPAFEMQAGWPVIIIGGLLVGFGTQLGSGCTSGHGVCGLSALSLRSLAAVVIFMAVGMAIVAAAKLVIGV
jgi:uncharacterized membrane protein YedE/YeeE